MNTTFCSQKISNEPVSTATVAMSANFQDTSELTELKNCEDKFGNLGSWGYHQSNSCERECFTRRSNCPVRDEKKGVEMRESTWIRSSKRAELAASECASNVVTSSYSESATPLNALKPVQGRTLSSYSYTSGVISSLPSADMVAAQLTFADGYVTGLEIAAAAVDSAVRRKGERDVVRRR